MSIVTMQMTILVVDDDPTMLMALNDILSATDNDVTTAYDGEDALTKLRAMNPLPDVILSDVMMPVMGGKELWERLQICDVWCEIPVIFIAGSTNARPYPDANFLAKPFRVTELLDLINKVVQSDSE